MLLAHALQKYGITLKPVVRANDGVRMVPHQWFAYRQLDDKDTTVRSGYGATPYQAVRACVSDIKKHNGCCR